MVRLSVALMVWVLSSTVYAAGECGGKKPEKFDQFFNRFLQDASFAKKRTRYPLAVHMRQSDSQEIRKTSISATEDEGTPALGEFMQDNEMIFTSAKVERHQAQITMLRAEPSWQIEYLFALNSGCWYLTQIEDRADLKP